MAKRQPARDQDKFVLRLPQGMRERIKVAAEENERSMNAEIVERLMFSFARPATPDEISSTLSDEPLPLPPVRMLDQRQAANYVGLTMSAFETECPVPTVRLGRRELWDRKDLDAWIDAVSAPNAVSIR